MVTTYDPRAAAINVAGNTAVVLLPAVTDTTLAAVTLAEYNAGTAIEAAIREFGVTPSVATSTEQFLSDTDVSETDGATTWSVDPVIIQYGDPQAANPLIDGLTVGATKYIVQRLGIPRATAAAVAQKVRVIKVTVRSVSDVKQTANADGNKYEVEVNFAVKKVNRAAALTA